MNSCNNILNRSRYNYNKHNKAQKKASLPKILDDIISKDIQTGTFPPSDDIRIKTNKVVYKIIELGSTDKTYTDLTYRFPINRVEEMNIFLLDITMTAMLF